MAGWVATMPTARERMEVAYANAGKRVTRTRDAVEKASKEASAARLNQLLQMRPNLRIGQLTDPLLTATDALKLTRSLQHTPRRSRYRVPLAERLCAVLPRLQIKRRLLSRTTLLFLLMATIYSSVAWSNTARLVSITRPIQVTLQSPDGSKLVQHMGTQKPWQLLRIRGDLAVLRIWFPRQGYNTVEVPSEIIADYRTSLKSN